MQKFSSVLGGFLSFLSLLNSYLKQAFFESVAKHTIKPFSPAVFLNSNLLITNQFIVFNVFYFNKNSCFFVNWCW